MSEIKLLQLQNKILKEELAKINKVASKRAEKIVSNYKIRGQWISVEFDGQIYVEKVSRP